MRQTANQSSGCRPVFLAALLALGLYGAAEAGQVELVSRANPVLDANGSSFPNAISADGRFVAFLSDASNLIPGQDDVNGRNDPFRYPNRDDVFLYDKATGTIALVSHASSSPTRTGTYWATSPVGISADGNWVVFQSFATDLVAGQVDTNGMEDVFLWERATGTIRLVSRSSASPAMPGNSRSFNARISADGRYVAFVSYADNLVPGLVKHNISTDIFLYDRDTDSTVLVSHSAASSTETANWFTFSGFLFSGNGRYVAFVTPASDVVPGQTETGSDNDIFLYDGMTGANTLVTHTSGSPTTASYGNDILGSISSDGRYLAFHSSSIDLVAGQIDSADTQDLFLYDRVSGASLLVSHAPGSPVTAASFVTSFPVLSTDGRFIAFSSSRTNVVPGQVDTNGQSDVFLWDRLFDSLILVSRRAGTIAETGSGQSSTPVLSADGRFISYWSTSANLVPGQSDPGAFGALFLFGLFWK